VKHISFAWTTRALLAGAKTVTRREWNDAYAARFHKDEFVVALDKSPMYGGRPVAVIRLTRDPYLENPRDAPDADFAGEGFSYMDHNGTTEERLRAFDIWIGWKEGEDQGPLWVVRFELVAVVGSSPCPHGDWGQDEGGEAYCHDCKRVVPMSEVPTRRGAR
jgi:hypothetical protein